MPEWDQLNAYIDGELPTSEAAKIAKAAASTPSVAQDIAELAQLKATLSRCDEIFSGTIMPHMQKHRHSQQPWLMVACASICSLVLLLVCYGITGFDKTTLSDAMLNTHQQWAKEPLNTATVVSTSAGTPMGNTQTSQDIQTTPPYPPADKSSSRVIPDLSALALQLAYVSPFTHHQQKGLHIGYQGQHGCKVSLFIFTQPSAGDHTTATQIQDRHPHFYHWRSDTTQYYLTAHGMAKQRFSVLSVAMMLQTQHHLAQSLQMMSLTKKYQASIPCTG